VSRRAIAIYAFCIALFGAFCYFAHGYDYFPGDVAFSQWLQGVDSAWFEPIMRFAPYILGLALVVVLLFRLWWRRLIFIAVATGAAGLIAWILKLIVNRPRPELALVQVMVATQGSDFPSGHAAMAVAAGGFLFYLMPSLVRSTAITALLRALIIVIIAAVGVSRIYLGAHWLSDVVGGLCLGGLVLYPAIVLYKKYGVKNA
jgi:membrane-associated phospholipid phosphatase